jgi:hypothetical protein
MRHELKQKKKTDFILTRYTECPRTRGSNLNCIFLDGNEGKKRFEK